MAPAPSSTSTVSCCAIEHARVARRGTPSRRPPRPPRPRTPRPPCATGRPPSRSRADRAPAMRAKFGGDSAVDVGRGRRLEQHGVGEHRREQDRGDRHRESRRRALVARRDDRGGRAHRHVEEEHRAPTVCMSPTRWWSTISTTDASSMPGRGLGALVVVDEHDPAARAAGDVGAREDADHPAVVVGHDRLALRARDEVLGGLGKQRLGADRRARRCPSRRPPRARARRAARRCRCRAA